MTGATKAFIALLAAGLCAIAPALAFDKGQLVLGQWAGEEYWYPGTVEDGTATSVTILYLDGDRDTRPINQVKPYDWGVGSKVECNWLGKGTYYSGVIAAADRGTLAIAYDDGDKETTTAARCRSL